MDLGRDEATPDDAPHYSVEFLAARWAVDKVTVRRLIKAGELAPIRVGRQLRFTWRQIVDYEARSRRC